MSMFKNYFDGIDDSTNTAAECGEIRARASKIKKRRKVFSSAAGVTLAVMMTTTVAVSAAGGWDISAVIGRWFKGSTALLADNLSEVTAENIENGFEFLEITPNGAVTDENMAVFFLDVTRSDGKVFNSGKYQAVSKDGELFYDTNGEALLNEPFFWFDLFDARVVCKNPDGEEFGFKFGVSAAPISQYVVEDENPSDNKITIALCIDKTALRRSYFHFSDEEEAAGTFDYEVSALEIKLGGLTEKRHYVIKQYESGTVLVDGFTADRIYGTWYGELALDVKQPKQVSIAPGREAVFKVNPANTNPDGTMDDYDYSFTVEKITVSQMSVSFTLNGEAPEKMRFLKMWNVGEIIMKNGDRVAVPDVGETPNILREYGNVNENLIEKDRSERWTIHVSVMLDEAVDPGEVAAVRLGDTVFPLE